MIAAVAVILIAGLAAILAPALIRKQRRGPGVLRWENGRWVATYRKLR